MKLGVLGSGFPLYFHFKMFTWITYLWLSAVVGIPWVVLNFRQDRGGQWVDDNNGVFLSKTTLGNHGKGHEYYYNNSDIDLIIALNSAFILVLFILSLLLRAQQSSIILRIESKVVTPSDFTLMAYNLPLDKTWDELQKWLEANHWSSKIRSISYCYNIRTTISYIRKLNKMTAIRNYLETYKARQLEKLLAHHNLRDIRKSQLMPPAPSYCWIK